MALFLTNERESADARLTFDAHAGNQNPILRDSWHESLFLCARARNDFDNHNEFKSADNRILHVSRYGESRCVI